MVRKYFFHNGLSLGVKTVNKKPEFNTKRPHIKWESSYFYINDKKVKYYYNATNMKLAHFYFGGTWRSFHFTPTEFMKSKGHNYKVDENFIIEYRERI